MNSVRSNTADYDMYKIGRAVYFSVTAMLDQNIANVNPDSKNIMVDPESNVYFIDMDMASRQSEIEEMLSDATYAQKYVAVKRLADLNLGSDAKAEYQVGLEYSSTVSYAIGSLPTNS